MRGAMWLKLSAWGLLLNGLAGWLAPLGMALWRGGETSPGQLLAITPLCGIAAGLWALRGRLAGVLAGLGLCAVQAVGFFSPGLNVSVRSGLSLASVHVLPQGVLVINWAAMALGALCAFVLWQGWRSRAGSAPPSPPPRPPSPPVKAADRTLDR